MNRIDAQNHIDNGGVVTCGGYTFATDKYFAFGTYPGCIRGGSVSTLTHKAEEWTALTEKDIVCLVGYKKDHYYPPILNDGTINFDNLHSYLELIRLNTNFDITNPRVNSRLCREYFDKLESGIQELRMTESITKDLQVVGKCTREKE